MHAISLDGYTVGEVHRLEDLGVTDAIVTLRNVYERDALSLQQKADALRRFADDVIAKV